MGLPKNAEDHIKCECAKSESSTKKIAPVKITKVYDDIKMLGPVFLHLFYLLIDSCLASTRLDPCSYFLYVS